MSHVYVYYKRVYDDEPLDNLQSQKRHLNSPDLMIALCKIEEEGNLAIICKQYRHLNIFHIEEI